MLSSNKRRWFTFACLFICVLLLNACRLSDEKTRQDPIATTPPLNICYGESLGTLLMVAEQEAIFHDLKRPVTLIRKPIGRANIAALNEGSCDIAIAAETPVVRNSFLRDDFKIIGTIAQSRSLNRLVTFSDSGIESGADLKNHRIATAKNSTFHFFLDVLLAKHGMTDKDITFVDMKGSELIPALEQKAVDAIVTTDMHALRMKERMGNAIRILSDPGLNLNYAYLLADNDLLEAQPARIEALLLALLRAQDVVQQSPDRVKALYGNRTGLSAASVETLWSDRNHVLSFNHIMLATLEDHARWMLKKGAVEATQISNFLDTIQTEILQKLAPKSVTLMR